MAHMTEKEYEKTQLEINERIAAAKVQKADAAARIMPGESRPHPKAQRRIKRLPPDSSEHKQQVTFFEMLDYFVSRDPAFFWIHAIPNGGMRNKAVAGQLKAEGLTAGVWDIFVPIPRPDKGLAGLYIEMKYGYNKLTDDQRLFGDYARLAGFATAVCWSWQAAFNAVCHHTLHLDWLIPGYEYATGGKDNYDRPKNKKSTEK